MKLESDRPREHGMAARRARLAVTPEARTDGHAPVWESIAAAGSTELPTTSDVLHPAVPPRPLDPAIEAAILAVLQRPLGYGETHHAGNARREHELYTLFGRLDANDARRLARRLTRNPEPGDLLAAAFRRLIFERRQRLCAFLSRARRRSNEP